MDESNPLHEEVLDDIKRRFREETFTRESIAQVIHAHSELVGVTITNREKRSKGIVDTPALRKLCHGPLPDRR